MLRRKNPSPPVAEPVRGLPQQRALPAELLRKLEIKIIRRLDGFLFGDYKGFFYGPSLDLAEVREYQPGDEVRRIDWNVTARTGKLHIRQYREEKEVTAWMIVDLSASMRFGTRRVLKLEEALEFAGTTASIVTRHGDKAGAIGFSEAGLKIIPPGSGRQQSLRILHGLFALGNAPNAGTSNGKAKSQNTKSDLFGALEYVSKTLKRRGLLFVVSDFLVRDLNNEPEWASALRQLAFRHDVIAVRITDPAEQELPNAGELRMRDPETNQEIWIDTSDPRVRRAHKALVEQREATLERIFRSAQVDLLKLSTAQEIVEPLLKFTLRRRGTR